jgi:hypothetical protein
MSHDSSCLHVIFTGLNDVRAPTKPELIDSRRAAAAAAAAAAASGDIQIKLTPFHSALIGPP